MGGGLLQLVAYGAQDAYISGNPQITFWKGLYKRHTNFAMEAFRVNLTGQANWGYKHSAVIPRHADLMYTTYLEVVLPATTSTFNWLSGVSNINADRLGYMMLKTVELMIGETLIDRLYGEWLYIWDKLTLDANKSAKMQALVSTGGTTANPSVCGAYGRPIRPTVLYIPLPFFYTRNPSCALPLIALQFHEVRVNIEWRKTEFFTYNPSAGGIGAPGLNVPPPSQAALYVDYIYLDVEERRRMAQEPHEYLIEQVQYNQDKPISSYNNRIDLTFNHPVKEIVWVTQASWKRQCKLVPNGARPTGYLQPFLFDDITFDANIQINGQDRFERRYGDYFSDVQTSQHHNGVIVPGVSCYSFSLRPEEHQPSGSCNFSRIDTATIVLNVGGDTQIDETKSLTYDVRVYAINYNILRIMSGMAGVSFSN